MFSWFSQIRLWQSLLNKISILTYSCRTPTDETLSQTSTTSASTSGVYEIPARLRTLHNLVIQYASQVS